MARFEDTCKTNTEILKAIFKNGKSGDKKEYIMQKRVERVKVNINYTYTISITISVGDGKCKFQFTGKYNDPKANKDNVSIWKYIADENEFFTFLNYHFSEKKLLKSQSESAIPTKAQVKQAPVKGAWMDKESEIPVRQAKEIPSQKRPVSAPAAAQGKTEEPIIIAAEATNKAAVEVLQASKEADKAAAEKENERLEKERKAADKAEAEKENERLEKERLENEKQKAEATKALEAERKAERERLAATKTKEIIAAEEKQKVEEAQAVNKKYESHFWKLFKAVNDEDEKKKIKQNYTKNIFTTKKTTPVKDLSSQNSKLRELISSLEQLNKNPNAPPPPAAPPAKKAKPSAITAKSSVIEKGNVVNRFPPLPPPGSGFVPAGADKVTTTVPPKPKQTVGFNAPRNDSRIIYFYGNYEPEGANIALSKPVDLASVLKLRIAEGKWIHYNYQSKENTGNLSRTAQITNKYPYLHLNLTQTADGKWRVKGTIHPSDGAAIYDIIEGELPPKNKGGRVGGSKMGRSTVLGRIMSIIRGSIKHVTRKKGRKPRSKTRRYKNKSQKKEKNKLNITKKVRFNRNKI